MWKKQDYIFFLEFFCNAGKESRDDGPLTKYSELCGQGNITVTSLKLKGFTVLKGSLRPLLSSTPDG
jgi:hypothetical protein